MRTIISLTPIEVIDLKYAFEIAEGNTGDERLIRSINRIYKKLEGKLK